MLSPCLVIKYTSVTGVVTLSKLGFLIYQMEEIPSISQVTRKIERESE